MYQKHFLLAFRKIRDCAIQKYGQNHWITNGMDKNLEENKKGLTRNANKPAQIDYLIVRKRIIPLLIKFYLF
ncbi:MAG: hypothetical protein DBX37_03900 [Massilioclostridium sp.]|nr:MAG: hypothetical protein DBX37_03900 [Massilioclostridium sp.]